MWRISRRRRWLPPEGQPGHVWKSGALCVLHLLWKGQRRDDIECSVAQVVMDNMRHLTRDDLKELGLPMGAALPDMALAAEPSLWCRP